MKRLTPQRILSLTLLALLTNACLSGRHVPFDPTASRSGPEAPQPVLVAERFAPDPVSAPITLTSDRVEKRYTVSRLETLSEAHNRQDGDRITGYYYEANRPGRRPLVVVLPIWGASSYPQRVTTDYLLERRDPPPFDVMTLDGEHYLFDWPALRLAASPDIFLAELRRSVAAFETTVRDVRRLLAWAASRPEVDERRVALVGFSASAILAADVMALEPRLAAGVFVMGGSGLQDILATCPRRPGHARRNILALTGWSVGEYAQRIEPIVRPVDPIHLAGAVDPGRVLMIDAGADSCIPRSGRDGLWEALGRPERLTLPLNHRASFLTMTPLFAHHTTKRIVAFLERFLGDLEPSQTVTVAGAGLD